MDRMLLMMLGEVSTIKTSVLPEPDSSGTFGRWRRLALSLREPDASSPRTVQGVSNPSTNATWGPGENKRAMAPANRTKLAVVTQ